MKIYCNSSKESTFVRFGKRFKHGKSINYLAMNPRIKDIYSERLAELQYGYITEDEFNEWCEQALESFVWEPNTSCFRYDPATELPILDNVSQAKTLIGFIQRFEQNLPCSAFLVKGEQVGLGTDKEPLVNVTSEEPIEYDINDLIDVVLDSLESGFRYSTKVSSNSDSFIHIQDDVYQYKNTQFSSPKYQYIADYEYTGPILDKLKYEQEANINRDDMLCIYIDADTNGGKEEIADMVWSWGNSVYDKPYYFENDSHVAILIVGDDLYIYGDKDSIYNFVDEYPVDYDEVNAPVKLKNKYDSMKFYG